MIFSALAAAILGATTLLDQGSQQTVAFEANHPLETIVGTSHAIEGAFEQLPDGTLHAHLRAPLATFSTGRSVFDSEIQEALDARNYPLVEVRVSVPPESLVGWPLPQRGTVLAWVKLTLHGESHTLRVPVEVTPHGGDQFKMAGSFSFQLGDFGVSRPAFALLPVADRVRVRFDLLSVPNPSIDSVAALRGSQIDLGMAAVAAPKH